MPTSESSHTGTSGFSQGRVFLPTGTGWPLGACVPLFQQRQLPELTTSHSALQENPRSHSQLGIGERSKQGCWRKHPTFPLNLSPSGRPHPTEHCTLPPWLQGPHDLKAPHYSSLGAVLGVGVGVGASASLLDTECVSTILGPQPSPC